MNLNKERVISLLFFVFALVMIYSTSQLKSMFAIATTDVGPKLFPYMASGGILLCSIGKFVTAGNKASKPYLDKEGWKRVVVIFLVFILYLLSMYYFGFLISTPIFLALFVLSMREENKLHPVNLTIFAVLLTAILYFVFQVLIKVRLPVGEIF